MEEPRSVECQNYTTGEHLAPQSCPAPTAPRPGGLLELPLPRKFLHRRLFPNGQIRRQPEI